MSQSDATIPTQLIESIAGAVSSAPVSHPDNRPALPEEVRREIAEILGRFLTEAGSPPTEIRRKDDGVYVVDTPICPIAGRVHQTGGNPGGLVYPDGRPDVHCFCDSCADKGLPGVEKRTGRKFIDFVKDQYSPSDRAFNDPIRLAQAYVDQTSCEGAPIYTHINGTTPRYDAEGWRPLARGEENPHIRAFLQSEYDGRAKFVGRLTGKAPRSEPITIRQVNETWAAVESLVRRRIPASAQPPFWLDDSLGWNPLDIVVFRNSFFNVRHRLAGQPYLVPRNSKLYFEYSAPFDYEDNPAYPQEWHKFLESLEQPEDWILQLQQIMAYLLWSAYDLQKCFHFYGPPRCGKGVLAKVIADLGGGAVGMSIEAFADPFGLEKAAGKRVLMVNEVGKGPYRNKAAAVVNTLKAITGGDEVEVNRKHIKNISMRLPGKIVMFGNSPLDLPDNSGALMARNIPSRLIKSFVGCEDRDLSKKLALEYPGIFAWCLEGLRSLYAAGQFTLCESTARELEQGRNAATPLLAFIEDCCDVDPNLAVHCQTLYRIYEMWAGEQFGHTGLEAAQFGAEVRTALPTVDRKRFSSGETSKRKAQLVSTRFDSDSPRPWCYVGIAPKREFCQSS